MRQLYQVKKHVQERSPNERWELHRRLAVPIFGGFARALPKSSLGKVFSYAELRWQALRRATDGDWPSTTTPQSERCGGSPSARRTGPAGRNEGGRRAAIFYSQIASASLQGNDLFA